MAWAWAFTQSSCTLPPIFIDFVPCRVYTEDSNTFVASSTNATKTTSPEKEHVWGKALKPIKVKSRGSTESVYGLVRLVG